MKISFHEKFYEVYITDPAAASGTMEAITEVLGKDFQWVTPSPARDEDLTLVHTAGHVERIKRDRDVYEVGILSAGGAILAARTAYEGEPAFGLIRPPGHHASPDSCWGFCYFNNLAVARGPAGSAGRDDPRLRCPLLDDSVVQQKAGSFGAEALRFSRPGPLDLGER